MSIPTLTGTKRALGLVLVTCVLAGGMVLGGRASALNPTGGTGGGPTFSSCKSKYDGKSYDLGTKKGKTNYNNFKKDDCNVDNNGYCQATATQKQTDGGKTTIEKIKCTKDGGSSGGNGNGDAGDGGITDPALTAGGCDGAHCTIIDKYINPLIKLLSAAVGVVAVIAIIVGGIQVSMSAGDPQKAANGRGHIRNALIGLVAYILLLIFLNWIIPGGIT